MDPLQQRWADFEKSRTDVGVPAMYDPTAMAPMCGGLRIRREYVARDAINSRAWDFFHATPPTQTASANLVSQARDGRGLVYMDMNPINSRTNNVKYRLQPEYIPDPSRGAPTNADLGVPPPVTTATRLPPAQFSLNEYTQRLDAKGEYSRNMVRELRSAVTEDNRERQVDADRALAARQFYDRWLPAVAATDAASLQAYELLKPKRDDWRDAWAGEDLP